MMKKIKIRDYAASIQCIKQDAGALENFNISFNIESTSSVVVKFAERLTKW